MAKKLTIEQLKSAVNIAELLSEQELSNIGSYVCEGLEIDLNSLGEWKDRVDEAMKIAKQTVEIKNTPWENASNIKYPLLSWAAIDFSSRIYPEFIQNDKVVRSIITGKDSDFSKQQKAARRDTFMNWQLLSQSNDWEDNLDKMLPILAIVGTVFKKTYYDPIIKRVKSDLCTPDKIIVNYNTQALEEARRITHILCQYRNDIIARMRKGLYLEVDINKLGPNQDQDDECPHDAEMTVLEQFRYLDLDEDDYAEPYIVTVHKESKQVLRIVNAFSKIQKNSKGEVSEIEPRQYYTAFHFLRSPDNGFYSMGLGTLLYPLNDSINTLLNQLVDSGTLNNMQSGLISKTGLRLRSGEFKFRMGEYTPVDTFPGTSLANNVFPLPTKEPSATLFQLLGFLVDIGRDIMSATDLLQGKGETQNVAATTTLAMIDQGMKVFNAVHKRLYRCFKQEFEKLVDINREFVLPSEYSKVLSDPQADIKKDFSAEDINIVPVADPTMSSQSQRLAKAQVVASLPSVDRRAADIYLLQSMQIEDEIIKALIPPVDPNAPPPPDAQALIAQAQKSIAQAQEAMANANYLTVKAELEKAEIQLKASEMQSSAAERQSNMLVKASDIQNKQEKTALQVDKQVHKQAMDELKIVHQREKDQADLTIRAAEVMKPEEKSNAD